MTPPTPVETAPAPSVELEGLLSPDAVEFIAELHRAFDRRRRALLERRVRRGLLSDFGFSDETRDVRETEWAVAAPRADYCDRRVEITGPPDRKMVINALNSGARGFMADFEDALSPTWGNLLEGQRNLRDAVRRTLTHSDAQGRRYTLDDRTATLIARPRGWHLPERHVRIGGEPASGALVDFGLYAFHCAAELLARGSAPYLYLPKTEHHLEARLWNDVFAHGERALGLPHGSFRATVLIETLPAAFQMDEILWELRERSYGLNAGRWDYIFSAIKCSRNDPRGQLPDRADVTMTVPFMRAYTERLVQTCHRRGTFAMGGMAALVPSRADPDASARAIAAVRADKRREADDGFDGTWVAHPDVVSAAAAEFDAVLADRPNQIGRLRPEVTTTAAQLLDLAATPGAITEPGLRRNVSVALRYLSLWLTGTGAAAIDGAMEDAATAEICRAQLWQWLRHGATTDDGAAITPQRVATIIDQELRAVRATVGEAAWASGRLDETRRLLEQLVFADEPPEFLTTVGYPLLR